MNNDELAQVLSELVGFKLRNEGFTDKQTGEFYLN